MTSDEKLKSALVLYKKSVTPEFIEATLLARTKIDTSASGGSASGTPRREGIFDTLVVVWLMIFQRLNDDHTLSAAIEHLRDEDTRELLYRPESKSIKARTGKISPSTGGYSQGRSRVDLSVVEQVTDRLNQELSKIGSKKKKEEKIYAIDGTTILIAHSKKNVAEYSQHNTRLGVSHYPLTRVTIATDVYSGVAMRPAIGAHNGSKATSEVAQATQEVLEKLEKGAIILADRYYGVTQVVHKAEQLGLKIIVRVKDAIAARVIKSSGGSSSSCDKESGEMPIIWTPSSREQKLYPHLTEAGATNVNVAGRYVWKTVHRAGYRSEKLFLFTTCDDKSADEVIKLYGLRWNIELDIRDLKTTLELNFITAKSPDMVKKEIITGVAAYNLIRHFMKAVARHLDTTVRNLSFKQSLRRLATIKNVILANSTEAGLRNNLHTFLTDLRALKHPQRKKIRPTQLREQWRKGVKRYRRSSQTIS